MDNPDCDNSGAICGDGLCPYVPCDDFPKCVHVKELQKEYEEKESLHNKHSTNSK